MGLSEEKIKELLSQEECGWLDFKRKMYDVFDTKVIHFDWQRNELVRDIISLANGNTASIGQSAYLFIGADDTLKPDGTRLLFDVGEVELSRQQLMTWLTDRIDPSIEEINIYTPYYQKTRLFIIEIPPSRYVHKITRPLQTGKVKIYPENITFIRVGDTIKNADGKEIHTLERAKKQFFAQSKHMNPIWVLGIGYAFLGFGADWLMLVKDNPIIQPISQDTDKLFLSILFRLIMGITLGLSGLLLGWSLVRYKQIQVFWITATPKERVRLILACLLIIVFVVLVRILVKL